MLIGGEWRGGASRARLESRNPLTGKAWASIPQAARRRRPRHGRLTKCPILPFLDRLEELENA